MRLPSGEMTTDRKAYGVGSETSAPKSTSSRTKSRGAGGGWRKWTKAQPALRSGFPP